jgi:CCR4-NOT complex subunit CAF16
MPPAAVSIRKLGFSYDSFPLFKALDLEILAGSRVLLIGANGVGKTTLLKLIAGRHLLKADTLKVFGRSPFYDMTLSSEITLIDGDYPIHVDITVKELLSHASRGVDLKLQSELLEILEVDQAWRMNRVSEGQRRRVQLALELRKPARLLLLDEVSAHLDVVARTDLLRWLRIQSEKRGLTVIYTTHILDGLWKDRSDHWPTHLAFIDSKRKAHLTPIVEAMRGSKKGVSLLGLCEEMIRKK